MYLWPPSQLFPLFSAHYIPLNSLLMKLLQAVLTIAASVCFEQTIQHAIISLQQNIQSKALKKQFPSP